MAAGRGRGAGFAKLRIDRANARMNARAGQFSQQKPDDPVARLRDRAENMAATAAAMKKIADAADPLYKTLDDGQKRRLAVLTRMEGRFGGGGLAPPVRARHGWTATSTATAVRPRRHDRDGGPDRGGPDGSERARLRVRPETGRSRWIPAAFCRFGGPPKPGKTRPACWTSRIALLNDALL